MKELTYPHLQRVLRTLPIHQYQEVLGGSILQAITSQLGFISKQLYKITV